MCAAILAPKVLRPENNPAKMAPLQKQNVFYKTCAWQKGSKQKKKLRKQAPALSKKTWEAWLKFVKDNAGPRMYFILLLTGSLGLRCGEALALRSEDFNLHAECPHVTLPL